MWDYILKGRKNEPIFRQIVLKSLKRKKQDMSAMETVWIVKAASKALKRTRIQKRVNFLRREKKQYLLEKILFPTNVW